MEYATITGLRFTQADRSSGRMFLTDFSQTEAEHAIAQVHQALEDLQEGTGTLAEGRGERFMRDLAKLNPELYLYSIQAKVRVDEYVPERGITLQEKLGNYLADAINEDPDQWMRVYEHILQVWPHSRQWRVVSDVLCRAYPKIRNLSETCIAAFARSVLRDPYTWRAAFDAMMIRARYETNETVAQFSYALEFLNHYGVRAGGVEGISIPSDIYSLSTSCMRLAFEEQSEEMKNNVRNLASSMLSADCAARGYLATMLRVGGVGDVTIAPLEELYRSNPEEAERQARSEINVYRIGDWYELRSPDLVRRIGERVKDKDRTIDEKQTIGYRLSLVRINIAKKRLVLPEVSRVAREVLSSYYPVDGGDQNAVLAGCMRMLAYGSDAVVPLTQDAEMAKLMKLHSGLRVSERSVFDQNGTRKGAWVYMLQRYSLGRVMLTAMQSIINSADQRNGESVGGMFKIVADTYSPLNHTNPNVLRYAVPHRTIQRVLESLLEVDGATGRYVHEFNYMRSVLPSAVSALQAIVNVEQYENGYKEILNRLHQYCLSTRLTDPQQRALRPTDEQIVAIIKDRGR